MTTHLTTKIAGQNYVVALVNAHTAQPSVWVWLERTLADGSTVLASLSRRQWRAEDRARAAFAREIRAHMATKQ